MNTPIPVIVLGGTGYVAGEMLRLVDAHPHLVLGAAVSTTLAGEPIAETFTHLRHAYGVDCFTDIEAAERLLGESPRAVLLSAAPHAASAGLVRQLCAAANRCELTVVDASADFRFRDADVFAEIYGTPHPAPELLGEFRCAVPEHLRVIDARHAAHPGCFATTMLLGIVPLVASGLAVPNIYVSAVTGSTGAGRSPRETTHHPVRQSNLFAYQLLNHRHAPEVKALTLAATHEDIELHFVPHSGPFARGIHATIFAPIRSRAAKNDVTSVLREYYADSELVSVLDSPPRMKDVAGSAFAALSADVDGDTIVVCSVLDNLLKGAAGGAIQWVNRLCGWPESLGLTQASPGWL
jgi:N-acetyl-gamma-glutamyl-phosphate reductase common form